jgi:hypothetical protein
MKNSIKSLAICAGVFACATASYGAVTLTTGSVGAATQFSSTSLSTVNGTLSFSDILASPAGATIAGGVSQGPFANGVVWGEVFKWGGSVNGNQLTAFSMIETGGGGAGQYQPVLLDLGPSVTFNANASTFNPSLQPNLLSSVTLQPGAAASAKFLEFDLSGSDAVTLNVGDSYAFGFIDLNTSDLNFLRSNGTQADANGAPFQIASGGLAATSATVPGFGGGPRNLFIGLYTQPVPEPTSLALLAVGAGMLIRRRAKKS